MTFLLDVNVLIALIDPKHMSNSIVREWFAGEAMVDWATCPLTENGVVRIVARPAYPNSPGTPAVVAETLRRLRELGHHSFWPDEISLLDPRHVDDTRLSTSGQITDTYLLALALSRGGQLATLDRRLVTAAVPNGGKALRVIG